MTVHPDKGISSIKYNYLNLPEQVTQDSKITNYIYRADGVNVKKSGTAGLATDYLDGFQYIETNLNFVPTSEGYFNFENNKYIYNYTDHLGNVRLSYFRNGNGMEVLEENNYYPFGLKHEGYNGLVGNPSYNYKYSGKELQETGMYDYGARFYMPDLGRWGVVDPLAEKMTRYSPYNYAFNNPIRFIDPDGRQSLGWGLKDGVWSWHEDLTIDNYKERGFSEYKDDGSKINNTPIQGKEAEDTGKTYLGFEGQAFYIPADNNGSEGLLGLSNWFRDALAAITPSFKSKNETFFSFSGGTNNPDKETLNKLKPGDSIKTNDMFEYILGGYGRSNTPKGGDGFIQFGLDIGGIGNPFSRSSGSPSGPAPIESDTFGIWDRQYTGILRNSDGSPYGFKYKNVRGEGLSKRTSDSLNKAIKDSNNYWNAQYKK